MKKFIFYGTGLTLATLIFGLLTVYGFFDISDGKTQLIGSISPIRTEVDIHNNIVDTIHRIGLQAKKSEETMRSITPETSIDELKTIINTLQEKRESLEKQIEGNAFERNKQTIQQLFNATYLPTLIQYERGYRKFFSYASSKALDQKSLETFKKTINSRFAEYQQAHNILVDELNRVRRY